MVENGLERPGITSREISVTISESVLGWIAGAGAADCFYGVGCFGGGGIALGGFE
jgi:hypothetical protein